MNGYRHMWGAVSPFRVSCGPTSPESASQPSNANAISLSEIPDISDSPSSQTKPLPCTESGFAGLSLDDKPEEDEIPDMEDIPDMEGEGLEEEGDDAAIQVVRPSACVTLTRHSNSPTDSATERRLRSQLRARTYFKSARTTA